MPKVQEFAKSFRKPLHLRRGTQQRPNNTLNRCYSAVGALHDECREERNKLGNREAAWRPLTGV